MICLVEEFPCSPVQCVNGTNVCDDILHCDNGRDEYCGKFDFKMPTIVAISKFISRINYRLCSSKPSISIYFMPFQYI